MTSEDFNKKYKNYLGYGFYGLGFDNQEVTSFLDKVFEDFIRIKGFEYHQIKVKFGHPRFYAHGISQETCQMVELMIANILNRKKDEVPY